MRGEQSTSYTRPSPYLVNLTSGRVLVSVRKPSNLAVIKTPMGEVALSANGDVLVSYRDDALHVLNLDGIGKSVRVRLSEGPFAHKEEKVSLSPGSELVAATHKLTARDLHPPDGIARRHFKVLESGNMAVSEFSVESVMRNVSMIVEMAQNTTSIKDRRIIGDMSKMAAVINYMNGMQGYTEEK